MSLVAYPPSPQANGTALIVYAGPPNVAVQWSLVGSGSLTPRSAGTDARGVAGALYTPGSPGDSVTVSVMHGTAA